jgi:hypothetical protein
MLVLGRIEHIRFDVNVTIPRDEPEGPPLPWWLDAQRMLRPLWLPIDCFTPPDAIERMKRRPVHEANARSSPPEPRTINRAASLGPDRRGERTAGRTLRGVTPTPPAAPAA